MPEPSTTRVEQNPVPVQGQNVTSGKKTNRAVALSVLIVAVLAFAGVYYYIYSTSGTRTTTHIPSTIQSTIPSTTPTTVYTTSVSTTSYTTTISSPFISNLTRYLEVFDRSNVFPLSNLTTNNDADVHLVNVSGCGALLTTSYYLGSNFSLVKPVNFSRISKTIPFFEYLSIETYNNTVAPNATRLFNSNKGFCDTEIFSLVISNSTYSSVPMTVGGNPAYLLEFSNLTPAGIGYAITNSRYDGYVGKAPSNVDYYLLATMYKNVDIEVGDEGFSQSMNVSRLVLASNSILQYVKSTQS